MSKYGNLSRSEGHSKWFLQRTLVEHDRSMDHPWMQMIYGQSFAVRQYAAWLARNLAVFALLEKHAAAKPEALAAVHDPNLHRAAALECDLAILLGDGWREEAAEMASSSAATARYLAALEQDAQRPGPLLAHHFLQYNAVLSGGAYLGEMTAQKLGLPPGASGVRFYAFEGVPEGKTSARVQRYLRDFDTLDLSDADREEMLAVMRRIYADTEAMMSEVFELGPAPGVAYGTSKAGGAEAAGEGPPPPCETQLELGVAELRGYNGEDGGRILLSLAGELLDVSSGRELYGPGGGYAMLAGHDVSRCLATMSLEPDHLDDLSWAPASPEDQQALDRWREKLKAKYPLAGRLLCGESGTEPAVGESRLRQRTPAASAAGAALPTAAPAADQSGTQKCPISGKEGAGCPMASFMDLGKSAPASAAAPEPRSATAPRPAFTAGKSLVASVTPANGREEESFLYRLCPLHWDEQTTKMLILVALAAWISGAFAGWGLRRQLMS